MRKEFKEYLESMLIEVVDENLITNWLMSNNYEISVKNVLILSGVYLKWMKKQLR